MPFLNSMMLLPRYFEISGSLRQKSKTPMMPMTMIAGRPRPKKFANRGLMGFLTSERRDEVSGPAVADRNDPAGVAPAPVASISAGQHTTQGKSDFRSFTARGGRRGRKLWGGMALASPLLNLEGKPVDKQANRDYDFLTAGADVASATTAVGEGARVVV